MKEHECFCSRCTKPTTCPNETAVNQYNAVVEQNRQLQKDLNSLKDELNFAASQIKHLQKVILAEGKENPTCRSYDYGYCETAPHPFSVKCCDLPECKWHSYDFTTKHKGEENEQ